MSTFFCQREKKMNTVGINFFVNCMMKQISVFALLLLSTLSYSQVPANGRIIILHPSVGNVIDQKEKEQFGLFKEYNDSLFESAELVKYNDTTFSFLITTRAGKSFERPSSDKEVREYYNTIENNKPASVANEEQATYYHSNERERDTNHRSDRQRNRVETADIVFEVFIDALSLFVYILGNMH